MPRILDEVIKAAESYNSLPAFHKKMITNRNFIVPKVATAMISSESSMNTPEGWRKIAWDPERLNAIWKRKYGRPFSLPDSDYGYVETFDELPDDLQEEFIGIYKEAPWRH